ncbi:hypothetical protein DY000_02046448 [Brassica cretica]|uniref:Uncharacterized protein n=1 Tax=Brassica cretica TaxID=69181 RepID=A0ABQ7ERQ4_BRACR|nr:hypothetical protein DY000_02046448 [Brassica cretica]
MSFGGSHWCRPMSMDTHRSTDQDEDRSTDYSGHQSSSSAVRIMTHEDTSHLPRIDGHLSPTEDRWAPLTYRVRLPSIDSNRINARRPPPKPLANPSEPTPNPSDTTPKPI